MRMTSAKHVTKDKNVSTCTILESSSLTTWILYCKEYFRISASFHDDFGERCGPEDRDVSESRVCASQIVLTEAAN